MKDLIGQVVDNPSCCPDLTLKQRVIGFAITFCLGLIITIVSFGSFGSIFVGGSTWFAVWYTLGNLVSVSSSFFLVGPKRQCRNMLKPVRATISIIFVSSMIMTLVSALIIQSKLLIIIFVVVQFCSLFWYVMSYIPYGRQFCIKCMKSLCCGDKEDEKEENIL